MAQVRNALDYGSRARSIIAAALETDTQEQYLAYIEAELQQTFRDGLEYGRLAIELIAADWNAAYPSDIFPSVEMNQETPERQICFMRGAATIMRYYARQLEANYKNAVGLNAVDNEGDKGQ